jgi:DNA polymerase-3 subunit gamma/tau
MASQALYRKWRSQTFDEVVGQQHVTQTLINALKLGRVAHAYLFAGPRGTGKTSMARLLAKAVNCLAEPGVERPCNRCHICTAINEGRLLDLIEIDAASNTGVDDIRDLRDKVSFRPAEARIKFYIIDEAHMLSNSAFNALLKTLEEPPDHVIFVLATTEPERLPATITSRCQRFEFKRIKLHEITQHLAHIATHEGFTAEPAALEYIARQGGGSMRDAISLLDQLTAYSSEKITLELVRTVLGMVASHSVTELIEALLNRDVATGLNIINRVIGDGLDPRQFARETVEYLRAVMLAKLGDGASLLNLPDETLAMVKTQANKADPDLIVRATSLFNDALSDLKSSLLAIPQLPLELAFVEALTLTSTPPALTEPVTTPSVAFHASPTRLETPVTAPPTIVSPKPTAPVMPMPSVVTTLESSITAAQISTSLEQIISELEPKNRTMAEALRSDVRLHRVAGREIEFVTSEFMKGRFEKPQPKSAIDEVFSRVLGQPVTVRFLSENAVLSSSSPSSEGVQPPLDASPVTDTGSEALIKVAIEELGGRMA